MFINQFLTKNKAVLMEKRYNYMDGYLSLDLLYQKIHPLRDAADCLTQIRILKIYHTVQKTDSGNAIKNCYRL